MSDLFTPDELEKTRLLLELFRSNDLSELSVIEPDGFGIEVRSVLPEAAAPVIAAPQQVAVATPAKSVTQSSHAPATAPRTNSKTLNSPMVGIFYTSPSPGDPPYINVGDVVSVGQTIGLIEAMKVFSEIPAEAAGRIVEVLGQTGTLVQQSQPLFSVEPA